MFTKYLPQTQNYTFFSGPHETFLKIGQMFIQTQSMSQQYKEKWYNPFHPVWPPWIKDKNLQKQKDIKGFL